MGNSVRYPKTTLTEKDMPTYPISWPEELTHHIATHWFNEEFSILRESLRGAFLSVEGKIAGMPIKGTVDVATVSVLTDTPVYDNTAGTLTAAGTATITPIDGITLVVGSRILVKDQVDAKHNGLYVVSVLGDGATVGYVLTRSVDADESVELTNNMIVGVRVGTINDDKRFQLTTDDAPIVIGTTDLVFEEYTGGGTMWVDIGSDTAAVTGSGYLISAASNPVDLTLPLAPNVGDQVKVKVYDVTNPVNVLRNFANIQGAASDYPVTNLSGFSLVYAGATEGWTITDNIIVPPILTADQIASFPVGASAINPLALASDARFPTTDEKASFPATASAALPLALESDTRFPTANEKASFPAGATAINPLALLSDIEGLEWTVISADTLAVNKIGYMIDGSTSTVDLTLPLGPSVGDIVGVAAFNVTNTVRVMRNGSNIKSIADDIELDVESGFTLAYTGATAGWILVTEISGGETIATVFDGIYCVKGTVTTKHDTIAAALVVAGGSGLVLVGPGSYAESITIDGDETVKSLGGANVTSITGAAATGARVTFAGTNSKINGFSILQPTDATPAILHNHAGVSTAKDCFLAGSGASGKGVSLTGAGTMIGSGITYVSGTCDTIFEVDGVGHMTINNFSVIGATAAAAFSASGGGKLSAQTGSISSSTLTDGFLVADGDVTIGEVNFLDTGTTVNGIHATHADSHIDAHGINMETNVDNHILVDPAIIPTAVHVSSADLIRDRISYDAAAAVSVAIQFSDSTEGDVGTCFHGEVAVGRPENGNELIAGEGDSYTRGMQVLTTDGTADATTDGGNLTDVSAAAASASGSTFTFQDVTAGHAIIVGSSLSGDTDVLKHWGLKTSQTTAAVEVTKRSFLVEKSTTAGWTPVGVMTTHSSNFYRYANELFIRTNTSEHLRYGLSAESTWNKRTINGDNLYWMRIRILTTVTTAPVFEQFKLSSNRFEANGDGTNTYHGNSRYITTLQGIGNIFAESGGVVNGNIAVGSGGLPTGWNHEYLNAELNADGDATYMQFNLPRGIDTSFPLEVDLTYGLDVQSATPASLIMSLIPVEVAGVIEADPSGGTAPIARTLGETETLTGKVGYSDTQSIDVSDSDKLQKTTFTGFDVSSYYEGDMCFVRLEGDNINTSDIIIFSLGFRTVFWTNGEHLNL